MAPSKRVTSKKLTSKTVTSKRATTLASSRFVRKRQRGGVVESYQTAVLQATLQAAESLHQLEATGVRRRELINFLRGSSLAPTNTRKDAGDTAPPSCFALLEAYSASRLHEIVDSLVEEGYLEYVPESTGRLIVSRAGTAALRGSENLRPTFFPRRPQLGQNEAIESKLRQLRRRLAKRAGHAPYVVFPNATLAALVDIRPKSLADLAAVPGMGAERVRRYGKRILQALSDTDKSRQSARQGTHHPSQ